jgi:hypothetical protein
MKVKKFNEDLPDFTQNEKLDCVDLYVDTCARCENDEESIKIAFKNRKKEQTSTKVFEALLRLRQAACHPQQIPSRSLPTTN